MADVNIMNEGAVNEYVEISEVETKKRHISEGEVENIIVGLQEQLNYWQNIQDMIRSKKLKTG